MLRKYKVRTGVQNQHRYRTFKYMRINIRYFHTYYIHLTVIQRSYSGTSLSMTTTLSTCGVSDLVIVVQLDMLKWTGKCGGLCFTVFRGTFSRLVTPYPTWCCLSYLLKKFIFWVFDNLKSEEIALFVGVILRTAEEHYLSNTFNKNTP